MTRHRPFAQEAAQTVKPKDVLERLASQGFEPIGSTRAEFAANAPNEIAKHAQRQGGEHQGRVARPRSPSRQMRSDAANVLDRRINGMIEFPRAGTERVKR